MRSIEEVVARIRKPKSAFGFDAEALLKYLPFEHVKQFLVPEATAELWSLESRPMTRDAVLAGMREYMPFAWGKVEDHRGISAERSVTKMEAWIWLLKDDEVLERVKAASYTQYGAPKLKVVCEQYHFPIPDSEAVRRMASGEQCSNSCENGCG